MRVPIDHQYEAIAEVLCVFVQGIVTLIASGDEYWVFGAVARPSPRGTRDDVISGRVRYRPPAICTFQQFISTHCCAQSLDFKLRPIREDDRHGAQKVQ